MAEFLCRVATPSGEVVERTYVADDENALRRDLDAQDVMLLAVRRSNPAFAALARTLRLRGRISAREFLVFNKEFNALLRAGLPILNSLDILRERRQNPVFREALADVRNRVKSGEALSEAFAAQGGLFPKLYAASLASGERSGEMAGVLARFTDYSQRVLAIRRKVVSALIYPIILMCLMVVVLGVVVFFVIPRFNEFLKDFNQDLPLITKVLVAFALFCQGNWPFLLGGLIVAVVGTLMWKRTPTGQIVLDRLQLRVPLAGAVASNYAQNRFTRTLATLQAGGIPLVPSLELAARAVGNGVYERALLGVADRVREGQALWASLDKTGLLSDINVQLIRVGESTGGLEEMLNYASDFTDEEIDTQLTRMTSLIEPLMLVFMAVLVAIMLLSMYLPMIKSYGAAGV